MNKIFKCLVIIFSLSLVISCQNVTNENDETLDLIEYPTYEIEDYNKMDTYVFNETIDNVKYKYTYYFDNNMCVNSKEELTFKTSILAKEFYDEIAESDEYLSVMLNENVVTYLNSPEYFIYMMYPKDTLIELLNNSGYSNE